MKARYLFAACVVASCSKGGPANQTAAPAPKQEVATAPPGEEKPSAAPAAKPPEGDEMSITSKSPEAVDHFKKGRELFDNLRNAESAEHFKKATELDPEFALAVAYLGAVTPGKEAYALTDRAVELAKDLPEPERTVIEARQALLQNDVQKARTLLRRVADAKPKDWRVQLTLGQLAFGDENWDEAVSASQKALAASPKNAQAYNNIAYGNAWQARYDDAVAAAQKQIELLPGEPNPQDTLGEILLAAGRLKEALAAFENAAATTPTFTVALVGAAETRMYMGEWKEGYATLRKAHDVALRPEDKFAIGYTEMWAMAGQGKTAAALKLGESIEKAAQEQGREVAYAFAPLNRGLLIAYSGKRANALKLIDTGYTRAKTANLPAPVMRNLMLVGEQARLIAAWRAKKPADAEKAYATLEAEVNKAPVSRPDQSLLDWGQGMVAWSKGDAKAAVESMKKCSQFDNVCRFMLVSAQRAAGDKAGAADTLAKLKASPRRDDAYVFFWSAAK